MSNSIQENYNKDNLKDQAQMRKSKFTSSQIAEILYQVASGRSIQEVCQQTGISQATLYTWKKKYGSVPQNEVSRLQMLEEENLRLKRINAELAMDREMLQDILKKKVGSTEKRRQLAEHLIERYEVSINRACRLSGLSRSSWYQIEEQTPLNDSQMDQNGQNVADDAEPPDNLHLVHRAPAAAWSHSDKVQQMLNVSREWSG